MTTNEADLPLEHEWIPPRADVDEPSPAVFVLHGRGANERDLLPLARELADELGVVSFRAPDRAGPGFSWYEFDLSGGDLHSSQPVEADFRRSLDLVSESISAAVDAYGLDSDRVGLLGFSQGTITSFSLLLESPERFAWCVGLHGYLAASHEDRTPPAIEGKPVFVGAGTSDDVIPAERAERAAERFRELGADVTFETYDAEHGVGREEVGDVVEWVERTA